jgi:hypothetical protein
MGERFPDYAPDAVHKLTFLQAQVRTDDWPKAMVVGLAEIVAVGGCAAVTDTAAEVPDLVVSWVEVAVKVALPTATPVTTPVDELIVATEVLEDVQVTVDEKLPVPFTDAEHVIVPPTAAVAGQLALTEVMVGGVGTKLVPPPPPQELRTSKIAENTTKGIL